MWTGNESATGRRAMMPAAARLFGLKERWPQNDPPDEIRLRAGARFSEDRLELRARGVLAYSKALCGPPASCTRPRAVQPPPPLEWRFRDRVQAGSGTSVDGFVGRRPDAASARLTCRDMRRNSSISCCLERTPFTCTLQAQCHHLCRALICTTWRFSAKMCRARAPCLCSVPINISSTVTVISFLESCWAA